MHCRNLILRVSSNEDQSSNEYLGFLRLGESENDLKHRNAFCVHDVVDEVAAIENPQ